jgi:DNA invertase Pin-like site-specific DNA recombinase
MRDLGQDNRDGKSSMNARLISYLRVSTARQGASALGLEAQRAAVTTYARDGQHHVLHEYLEVESGGKAARPQLEAALAACKLQHATLVIAKIDRLARNVAFIANLMDGGVEFVACDMPHANRLTLHLFAAIAEHEREMISQRTKAALAAAKARGVKLGNPNGSAALLKGCVMAAQASAAGRRARAADHAMAVAPILTDLLAQGMTYRQTAVELNLRGVRTGSDGIWHPEQVRRCMMRLSSPG